MALGGSIGFLSWKQTDKGKIGWDRTLLKIPLLGNIHNKVVVSRFARNLGILLDSNVPLLAGLEIVGETVGSEVFKQELNIQFKRSKKDPR